MFISLKTTIVLLFTVAFVSILGTRYFEGGGAISEATRIGINDFIEKPFTAKTIEGSLSRLLEKQEEKSKVLRETQHAH